MDAASIFGDIGKLEIAQIYDGLDTVVFLAKQVGTARQWHGLHIGTREEHQCLVDMLRPVIFK